VQAPVARSTALCVMLLMRSLSHRPHGPPAARPPPGVTYYTSRVLLLSDASDPAPGQHGCGGLGGLTGPGGLRAALLAHACCRAPVLPLLALAAASPAHAAPRPSAPPPGTPAPLQAGCGTGCCTTRSTARSPGWRRWTPRSGPCRASAWWSWACPWRCEPRRLDSHRGAGSRGHEAGWRVAVGRSRGQGMECLGTK
jgi:hypothetical protein